MNLSLYIAKRYLFSKKSHQVINIISGVAIAGIALATAAMICTLSVFNGFQGLVAEQFTAFDPDIRIMADKGKSFMNDSPEMEAIARLEGVETVSFCIEDKALVEYDGRQVIATIKGVDQHYAELTNIGEALRGSGEFILQDELNSYGIPSAELMSELGCGIHFTEPLEVYSPTRGRKVNLTMPARNFKKEYLHSSGLIFIINQPKYARHIITSDEFARKLFRRSDNEVTSMEIKVKEGSDIADIQQQIALLLGEGYTVQDRYEQQNDVYKVMQIEKLISYIFLTFILLVACFNIVGSLSMLIIEKQDNMNTLRSMGADKKTVSNIFVYEGIIISALGALAGIVAGIALCLAQQHFGIISMGGDGAFVVDSYPVEVHLNDIITTFFTVLAVGIAAVWLPVRILTRKLL
ncbi:MAG: ABC transporter permease [Bacteroidaceae bacterium]|nr:ABC transporter permease [Bacteroidaceae bacterium]